MGKGTAKKSKLFSTYLVRSYYIVLKKSCLNYENQAEKSKNKLDKAIIRLKSKNRLDKAIIRLESKIRLDYLKISLIRSSKAEMLGICLARLYPLLSELEFFPQKPPITCQRLSIANVNAI